MSRFGSVREAKEYLVRRVVEQAAREAVPLSDIERQMLYFSETGWTLPNMTAVCQEFDRAYEQEEYEKKIGQIILSLRTQSDPNDDAWDAAVQLLRTEDHYLLVLIDRALEGSERLSRREIVGVIFGGVLVAAIVLPVSLYVYSHVENRAVQKLIIGSTLLGLAALVAFVGTRVTRRVT